MPFLLFSHCFLVDDELGVLRERIGQDYNDLSIRDLCPPGTSRGRNMIFFKLDDKSYEMVSKMPKMKSSRIFNLLWQKHCEKLKDEIVTMEMLFDIWSQICDSLILINQKFHDGEMQLREVDKYVEMFKTDYTALEDEFTLLSNYFDGATAHLVQERKKLGVVINKVKSYRKLFEARQAAQAILDLQKALNLKGGFSEVERIEKVRVQCFTSYVSRNVVRINSSFSRS